ncbi:MAG: DUF5011 domain-containing protein [Bacteroidetes bacterium]|nr:DUF5011 domain-containing protein [Bacteroidota bacterium]
MMKKTLLLNLFSLAVIALFAQTKVGMTTYDLQTNNSNCRRVVTNAAGEVVITYTRSYTYSEAADDRGTGYNYKNTSGVWSEPTFATTAPTNGWNNQRPDLDRTGWPNVGILNNGNEIVVSHFAGNTASFGGIQVMQRALGSGAAWNITELNSNNVSGSFSDDATWPRVAITGDSILVISAAQTGTLVNGVDGGMFMHRSTDGGTTWTQSFIPFVNGSNFVNVGGDVYDIDANQNGTVAIVVGRYNTFMLKSTDFGLTWTAHDVVRSTDINGNPNANNYSGAAGESAERQDILDESFSVIVDDNDNVHVWAGRLDYLKDDPNADGSVYPFSEGLMYWNESMSEPVILHASRFTVEANAGCNPLYTSAVINDPEFTQFGLYRSSLVSQPSASYDAAGNLVVAYTRMRTAIIDPLDSSVLNASPDGYFFKDVYLLKSADGGATWEGPFNVSNQDTLECAFPGLPRKFYNNTIPVIWMQDALPGNALQPPTGYSHPYLSNDIMYDEIPLSSIVTPLDETCPTLALLDPGINNLTISQGCNPSAEDYEEILVFDDVPQGPDTNMVNFVQGSITGSGLYDLYLVDNAGNVSDTVQINVTVAPDNTPPTYTFIGPDTLQVIIGDTYVDPGINYDDNGCYPAAAPSTTDNVNPTLTTGLGLATYVYTIVDNAGNSTSAVRYVEIISNDTEGPIITLTGGATDSVEVCTSYDEQGATAFDLVDYTVPVTINSSAVNINVVGSYLVTYTASDYAPIPNTSTFTRTVYVEDNTAPLLTVEDDNDLVTPADSYTEGGVNYTYVGTNFVAPSVSASDPNCSGQTVNVTVNDASVNTSTAGNYTAVVTATDENGNSTSQNLTVRVGTEPTPNFTYFATSNSIVVTNTSTGNPTSYLWDFGNGQTSTSPNSTPGVPTYMAGQTYTVCLTAKNRFNDAPFNKTAQQECKTVTISGIADRNELDASISVYPNPTKGLVNVEIADIKADNIKIEITNVIGTTIATKELTNVNAKEIVEFNLDKNAAGVYFINISSEGAYTTKRVIVK